MAPIPELVEDAIMRCGKDAILNVFAGIPAPVKASDRPRRTDRQARVYDRDQRIGSRRHEDGLPQGACS